MESMLNEQDTRRAVLHILSTVDFFTLEKEETMAAMRRYLTCKADMTLVERIVNEIEAKEQQSYGFAGRTENGTE